MSSNSIFEPVILCKKCGYVRIEWVEEHALPIEWKTKEIHYCEVSESFPCLRCSQTVYYDCRVLSPENRRIKLDQTTGKYHVCNKQGKNS